MKKKQNKSDSIKLTKEEVLKLIRECTLQQIQKNKEIDLLRKAKNIFKQFLIEKTRFTIEDSKN